MKTRHAGDSEDLESQLLQLRRATVSTRNAMEDQFREFEDLVAELSRANLKMRNLLELLFALGPVARDIVKWTGVGRLQTAAGSARCETKSLSEIVQYRKARLEPAREALENMTRADPVTSGRVGGLTTAYRRESKRLLKDVGGHLATESGRSIAEALVGDSREGAWENLTIGRAAKEEVRGIGRSILAELNDLVDSPSLPRLCTYMFSVIDLADPFFWASHVVHMTSSTAEAYLDRIGQDYATHYGRALGQVNRNLWIQEKMLRDLRDLKSRAGSE